MSSGDTVRDRLAWELYRKENPLQPGELEIGWAALPLKIQDEYRLLADKLPPQNKKRKGRFYGDLNNA